MIGKTPSKYRMLNQSTLIERCIKLRVTMINLSIPNSGEEESCREATISIFHSIGLSLSLTQLQTRKWAIPRQCSMIVGGITTPVPRSISHTQTPGNLLLTGTMRSMRSTRKKEWRNKWWWTSFIVKDFNNINEVKAAPHQHSQVDTNN